MGLNDLFTELEPCYDDRIIGQTSFALYTGSIWAGTLSQLAIDRMYRMRLCSQQSITLSGEPAPLEPVELNAGYTWLGYVPQECLPINEALANMEPAPSYDDRLIGQNSFALYTGTQWIGTLNTLCPGAGYVIRLANPVTLNWPGGDTGDDFSCGISTINDMDGNVYNTVLIGDQCWMAENLNYETGNCWCYNNGPTNCDNYGWLYDWETALNACPVGWHLPSDEEWKILEGTVDSQYGVGHNEWNETGSRGHDVGKKLKATSGWSNNGNGTDDYSFGALSGGYRFSWGSFASLGLTARFWTSTESGANSAWYRQLLYDFDTAGRNFNSNKGHGFSVRCLKD